jgi:hypothetical protein
MIDHCDICKLPMTARILQKEATTKVPLPAVAGPVMLGTAEVLNETGVAVRDSLGMVLALSVGERIAIAGLPKSIPALVPIPATSQDQHLDMDRTNLGNSKHTYHHIHPHSIHPRIRMMAKAKVKEPRKAIITARAKAKAKEVERDIMNMAENPLMVCMMSVDEILNSVCSVVLTHRLLAVALSKKEEIWVLIVSFPEGPKLTECQTLTILSSHTQYDTTMENTEINPPSGGHPDGGGEVPTDGTIPVPTDPVTISLSPFGLQYELADGVGTPTSDEYAMAIDVTMGFLITYMNLQYEGLGMEDFVTSATSTIWKDGVPQIDYIASATFRSSNPPSLEELDSSLTQAFTGASLGIYLNMLQALPSENKFSTTTGARLTNPANLGPGSRSSLIANVGAPGVAGAVGAGALVVIAIGFMIYGKEQKRKKLPACPAEAAGERRALRPTKKRPLTKAQRLQAQLLGFHEPPEAGAVNDETTTCSSDSTVKSGLSRLISARRASSPRIPLSIGSSHQKLPQNEVSVEEEKGAMTEVPLSSRDLSPTDPPAC